MIEIIKEEDLKLRINHNDYLDFLDDDSTSINEWYAISVQIDNQISNDKAIYSILETVFLKLIDNNTSSITKWYVMHDDKIMPWFYDTKFAHSFPLLKKILEKENLNLKSKGILRCDRKGIIKLSPEIISYPSLLSYKNIDCINDNEGLIIKITSHKTIDIISNNRSILINYESQLKSIDDLIIKVYNHLK